MVVEVTSKPSRVWNDEDILAFLATVRPFRNIPQTALRQAAGAFRVKLFRRGEFVFREGQTVAALHVLASGHVKIIRETAAGQEVILRLIRQGDIFGIANTWLGQHYRASALANTDSTVLELRTDTFASFLATYPDFDLAILHELRRRLQDADDRISDLQTKHAECRVARTLLQVARKPMSTAPSSSDDVVALSRQDLAELSGTNLSTVSRTVSDWERQGIVTSGRRRVRILKPRVLDAIAKRES